MSSPTKPLPVITATEKGFWDGAKRHELMVYQCANCGACYNPPMHCLACDNPQMKWVKASGRGKIYTFVVYHMAYHPAWKDDLPYNVAWIELEEGPLVMSNIVECNNEDIQVGMPVEVVFDDINEDVSLPKFRPAR